MIHRLEINFSKLYPESESGSAAICHRCIGHLVLNMWIIVTKICEFILFNGRAKILKVKGTMAVRETMAPFGGKISLFPLNRNLTLFNTAQNANRKFGADFT